MHESDDRADEPRADKAEPPGESAEDAAWREIVEHYGERAQLEDEPATYVVGEAPEELADDSFDADDDPDDPDGLGGVVYLEDVERYVPPPPPPLPRTTPERLMAWLGVLGSPVAAIVLVIIHSVTGYVFPTWVTAILVLAFLGGFGYLLVTMSREPGDPWDDGARV